MLTRAEIFAKLVEWRPGVALEWLNAKALLVGGYNDELGHHPEFVMNFGSRPNQGVDFSDLHFGSRFKFRSVPGLSWINDQNRQLRFAKLALDGDSVILTADLYGPDVALQMITFEGTFVLFDHALMLIRAMATN